LPKKFSQFQECVMSIRFTAENVLLVFIAALAALSAPAIAAENATITGDGVRLRMMPSTSGEIVQAFKKGTRLEVVSKTDFTDTIDGNTASWYEATGGGRTGFVFGKFVELDEEVVVEALPLPQPVGFVLIPGVTPVYEPQSPVPAGPIVIRQSPSEDSPIVISLENEEECMGAPFAFWDNESRGLLSPVHVTFVCRGVLMTESGYGFVAALVYERTDDWLLVGLGPLNSKRYGWLPARNAYDFDPLDELLGRNMTYATNGWDKILHPSPDRSAPGFDVGPILPPRDAPSWYVCDMRIDETRRVGDELWLKVSIVTNWCECGELNILRQGWIPAFSPNGVLSVWIYARGC
jgi:hypothetical protein